jgi:transketolase
MRNAFASELTTIAGQNKDVVLLSGDIGNKLFDKFKEAAPKRFFNCGVAEANMISAAAGMAMCGLRPVAYTITPFITSRCYEQIKIDLCYHNVPVVVVGVGAGLSYASLGATHQSCEDIAILRVLPHMTVICPGDAHEVRSALREALKIDGPVYIRLGKKGEPLVHPCQPEFKVGRGIVVKEGSDVCILSTGNMLPTAVECGEELTRRQISTRVVSLHTVKPLDEQLLAEAFSSYSLVVTLEEHSLAGGLGGSIAEWQSDRIGLKARLLRFGTADAYLHESGNQKYVRQHFGLTSDSIVARIAETLSEQAGR